MMRTMWIFLCMAIGATAVADETTSSLRLPKIFTDHMVLQRDAKMKLWGWAEPRAKVVAMLGTRGKNVTAGKDGRWEMELSPQPAGGPYKLSVTDGSTSLTLEDVLVGDVWLCGGQSNMEWPVRSSVNAEQETATANFKKIRFFRVMHDVSTRPKDELSTTVGWVAVTPDMIGDFSAVGYFFGRDLHEHLDVPIGLVQSAWGGSPAEAWISYESLKSHPDYRKITEEIWNEKTQSPEEAKRDHEEKMKAWRKAFDAADTGYKGNAAKYAEVDLDAGGWKTMELPNTWETQGLPDFDGLVWFRKEIDLPADMAGKELSLSLGSIDDADRTFFNGKKVGESGSANARRRYKVPGNLVKAGRNVVAIRVHDVTGGGGFTGDERSMEIVTAGKKNDDKTSVSLAGEWKYKTSAVASDLPEAPMNPNQTHRSLVMYNAMIAPLVPFTLRGAIWYQGESNSDRAFQYRTLFPLLIKDWREKWGQGDFPFLYVQLAGFAAYQPAPKEPKEHNWAELREAQTMTLAVPRTGMATAVDIGEANDIHPKNKQDVGKRLALAARHVAYGEKLEHSGPMYKSMSVKDGKISISFDHVGGGLVGRPDGEKLEGFAIAGEDKKFAWANAKIDGDKVVVWSDSVKDPVAVRYGWAGDPKLSLYNKEELPAIPFRTDKWKGLTDDNRRPGKRR